MLRCIWRAKQREQKTIGWKRWNITVDHDNIKQQRIYIYTCVCVSPRAMPRNATQRTPSAPRPPARTLAGLRDGREMTMKIRWELANRGARRGPQEKRRRRKHATQPCYSIIVNSPRPIENLAFSWGGLPGKVAPTCVYLLWSSCVR